MVHSSRKVAPAPKDLPRSERLDWFRRKGLHAPKNRRNASVYLIAIIFGFFAVICLPTYPTIPYPFSDAAVQRVTSHFPFNFEENISTTGIYYLSNGTVIPNYTIFTLVNCGEGDVILSGIGGLSVDNPLSFTIKIFPNSNFSQFNVVNITVHPYYGLVSPITDDSNGVPEFENITLTHNVEDTEWSGSGEIQYSVSGTWPLVMYMSNSSNFSIKQTSAPIFEIEPESVTVSATNNAYVSSFTCVLAILTVLALRKDKEGKDAENRKALQRGQ